MTRKSNIGIDTKSKLIKGAWAEEKSYCERKGKLIESVEEKTPRQNNVLTRDWIISINSGQKLIWKRKENEMGRGKKKTKWSFRKSRKDFEKKWRKSEN